ncbi:hypothetical protein [Mycobacterium sp. MMS18-G62]
MAAKAMRCIACAGMLAAGLLMGGGIAIADPTDSTSSGPEGTSASSDVDDHSGAAGGETKAPAPAKKVNSSLSIPVLRWPKPEEVHETGLTAFVATVDIPVPVVDAFDALRQPDPEPTPSFRTQEEAPVVDAGGGGSDMSSAATTGEPPVLKAPIVVAQLPVVPPAMPVAAPVVVSGPRPVAAEAAGANTPLTRGTSQQTAEPASSNPSFTPLTGQATRVGYPRDFRNPTLRDLAAVAFPGLGGLLFLTFGGSFLGYRQANSLRFIRTQGAARFLR